MTAYEMRISDWSSDVCSSDLANMDDNYAIKMVNWFPESNSLRVRNGYRYHAIGIEVPVKTLVKFSGLNGTDDRLFACTDAGLFDVTSSEQRRVGKCGVGTFRSRWSPYHSKQEKIRDNI